MDEKELLSLWRDRAATILTAHHKIAARLHFLHFLLGMPVTILSTIVGTSIFATLQSNPETRFKIIVGLASLLTAILSSMQTFLQFGVRAEKHSKLGAKLGAIMRELEIKLAFPAKDDNEKEDLKSYLLLLQDRYDKLIEDSPPIPESIWQLVIKTRKELKR